MSKEDNEKKLIMVVDDESDIRIMMKDILESYGFDTLVADSCEDCLDKLKRAKPGLILLDVMMPEKSGWDTLEALKEDHRTENIPVAMLTVVAPSYNDFFDHNVYQLVHYITKPFRTDELVAKVQNIFRVLERIDREKELISKKFDKRTAEDFEMMERSLFLHDNLLETIRFFYSTLNRKLLEQTEAHFMENTEIVDEYRKKLADMRFKAKLTPC